MHSYRRKLAEARSRAALILPSSIHHGLQATQPCPRGFVLRVVRQRAPVAFLCVLPLVFAFIDAPQIVMRKTVAVVSSGARGPLQPGYGLVERTLLDQV